MKQSAPDLKGKRILVTEDDASLRETIKGLLDKCGAETRTAENGLIAKTILELSENSYDLVLSDIRMPEMDGIALLAFCKAHKPATKFLIFTGFSEFLETHKASDLGADGFLAKPFKLAELLKMVEDILFPRLVGAAESNLELEEQKYCCVKVDEFFSATRLASDIYINIGKTKFIKFAKEGAEIELSKLEQFKQHKVEHLFVRNEDFHKYTGMNLKIVDAVIKSDKVSDEKKMRLFKHTGEALLQEIFVTGVDLKLCANAFDMVNNTIRSVSQNNDLFELLMDLQARGDKLYAHSLGVTVYASMIAAKMGWTSQANQHKIALAGLFHDIGFRELPDGLHEKPRFKMTPAESKLYESHPTRGKEILISVASFPSDLAMVVGQHHESASGDGYPHGISLMKTHPIARLIKVADEFADRLAAEKSVERDTPGRILAALFETKREEFDGEVLAAAFDLFSITRPVGLKNKAA